MKLRLLTIVILLTNALSGWAQDESEYRMEVGGGVGMTAYEGDFNGSLLREMQPRFGLVAKYRQNPRMSWALRIDYGQLKGSSDNVETWYPELHDNPVSFTSKVTNVDVRYEYNFWPFGTGREYLGAQRLTPFISLGAGLAFASCGESVAAFQLPLGFGVKYKVADRLNLTVDWSIHFTGSDRLDGVADPYGIKSSGLFKNTDCFSTLQLSLTYDVWAKCKTCHNDRD